MKIRKTVTAKRTRRQLIQSSSSDKGSPTPSQKEDADYVFEEEELGTTSQSTAKPSSGFAPNSDSDDDIAASLGDILSKLKRAKIREGKRKVEDNVKSTKKSTPAENPEQTSEASSIFTDSEVEADKAFTKHFYSAKIAEKWEELKKRNVYGERIINQVSFEEFNLVNFLKSRNLLSSVVDVGSYVKRTIQLVYVNMTESFADSTSNKFGQVYYNRKVYSITPSLINATLGLPDVSGEEVKDYDEVARVITGGIEKKWKKPMRASSLTYMYSVLHRLMTYNWIVTTNTTVVTQAHAALLYCIGLNKPFNLGQIIFGQIASDTQILGLPFPSLIYRLLKEQWLEEVVHSAQLEKVHEYSINQQLFSGRKVNDLPWVDPFAPTDQEPAADAPVMVTVPSTVLTSLLNRFVLLEKDVWRLYTSHTFELANIKGELERLLSSQKGGENGDGTNAGTGTSAAAARDAADFASLMARRAAEDAVIRAAFAEEDSSRAAASVARAQAAAKEQAKETGDK